MQEERSNTGTAERRPLLERGIEWAQQAWRPAGTMVAVALALIMGWGVVNGKHGLSAWQQQRTQDKELKKEIKDLQQENTHLLDRIQRLKDDPDTIAREAREQLHYARPGEVIYTLPAQPQGKTQPAANQP